MAEKTAAEKVGVKPGQRVRVVGPVEAALAAAGTIVDGGKADVVLLGAESADDLGRMDELRDGMSRDGAIWVIRPRGRADVTEAMVIAAGREAGLYDVKIARISDTHTGMKFVIPVNDR
ncbi:MAG TPA: hypothetical protein VFH74_07325 [Gaiellales bacterium]|nr:hypothetical protein [Gaiellales bacterium]